MDKVISKRHLCYLDRARRFVGFVTNPLSLREKERERETILTKVTTMTRFGRHMIIWRLNLKYEVSSSLDPGIDCQHRLVLAWLGWTRCLLGVCQGFIGYILTHIISLYVCRLHLMGELGNNKSAAGNTRDHLERADRHVLACSCSLQIRHAIGWFAYRHVAAHYTYPYTARGHLHTLLPCVCFVVLTLPISVE
ncbi:hypothetical protein F4810DRAFT_395313 [Camillea tinctor]|nr:hypothetical protein F4810DRAFT_395313 [Camillea tinctor]